MVLIQSVHHFFKVVDLLIHPRNALVKGLLQLADTTYLIVFFAKIHLLFLLILLLFLCNLLVDLFHYLILILTFRDLR